MEDNVIPRLRQQTPYDQAELFFRSAKSMTESLGGLEDAGFWSVQCLSLVSLYTLTVSKRNCSYAYYGTFCFSLFFLLLSFFFLSFFRTCRRPQLTHLGMTPIRCLHLTR
ncbi:hypothetical protein GGS23DRAFT_136260 [Durotheca rogersii]|uniref:uncharacterized protein n=1 Tax=Durotheca rogersii TaxID=419775 RepID=UPI00221F4B33|nr:uncharacterized protein GGS23DRAFT_136260 [Durotheca rogersii]KAI5861488.1 hypothetical protein GGS23DRAFT_136260 [Durotheca rogersii]